jgi:hypothetical protein
MLTPTVAVPVSRKRHPVTALLWAGLLRLGAQLGLGATTQLKVKVVGI